MRMTKKKDNTLTLKSNLGLYTLIETKNRPSMALVLDLLEEDKYYKVSIVFPLK